MKVFLVVEDDGGCGDPECCGMPAYSYYIYSTEEHAKRMHPGSYADIREMTVDEGIA